MPSKYKTFDWDQAQEMHSRETLTFLRLNHSKQFSLEEFTEGWRALPHDHRRRSKHRAPSYCRHQYARLQKRFGFFTGEVNYAE